MNKLYFADCLDVMKRLYHQEHQKEFIDLVYIDPPFNSKRNYNVLFESAEINDTIAQKEAFADTWSNVSYIDTFYELNGIDLNLYNFLNALDNISISKSAISYLATMAIRIKYIHRLLKPTGSFYLHCDPTMSHYLKIICDLVFGDKNFRNEIIWKRRTGSNSSVHTAKEFGNTADIILFYTKGNKWFFSTQYTMNDDRYQRYLNEAFSNIDENGRRYRSADLSNPAPRPNLMYDYKGYKHPKNGWAISLENMVTWDKEGRLLFPKSKDGRIRRKIYLDEMKGKPVQNIWDDINSLGATEKEKLGYPTQKPEALLERIIKASSNEGDLVADFFCGCGTTIAAAQKLNRRWLGSDISHLAIKLISKRLVDTYGESIKTTFEIHGFPKDLASAKELAAGVKGGRLLFEEWIVEVMLQGILNEKRNQMGYDGHLTFDMNGVKNVALIEVKSGGASPTQLNHFIKTVEDRQAQMGIFVCFADEVTDNMRLISKKQGQFHPDFKYPKIQILTVEDILEGKQPDRPASRVETFKTAEKKIIADASQQKLQL
jgi:site-specific DNA-methyltransferase (adenine-specific)